MWLIKSHILKNHNFDYPNPNYIPYDPQISDQDIESFNKVSSFLNLETTKIGTINSKINTINRTKLIELNYLSDVKIINTVIKTSVELRTW
jgi:hypothetical protein